MKNPFLKIFFLITLVLFSGCAYYNTFYNAKKFYKDAEKDRKKRLRTQVVELSEDEKARLKRSGYATAGDRNRASSSEMQKYQHAIEKASRVLEFYPKSKYVDDALMLLGECFYYRREYKKAQRKFEELTELYPKSKFVPKAKLLMAKTFLGLRDFQEAERRFREITIDEKFNKQFREEAEYELGGLYFEREDYELAAEHYQSTAKHSSDKLIRAMSLFRLGECYLKLKNLDEAPKVLSKAVQASPNEDFKSQATFKLGEAQNARKDYKQAIRTFSRLLSKEYNEKRIPRIKLQLANNLRLNGEMEEAIKWYNNIVEEHKRTDAAARGYFALGEIEEYNNHDYRKAQEDYDLVRGESASSPIVPLAKQRSGNIKQLLELEASIAKLEGREIATDSTLAGKKGKKKRTRNKKDDAPIDLGADGMWMNYSGRDRPPPKTLTELTEVDKQRATLLSDKQLAAVSAADSIATGKTAAVLDSAALAAQKEKQEKDKKIQLAEKKLALAQLLFFNFNKVDTAVAEYNQVVNEGMDSSSTIRALYSLGYIYMSVKHDTTLADSVLHRLIETYPESQHADGARKMLGLPLVQNQVDSAQVIYEQAEDAYFENHDLDKALNLYETIIEHYPESDYAPKAIYAKGWYYARTLYDLDQAKDEYQLLVDKYPDSPFTKKVQPELAAVQKVLKEAEAKKKAIADSLAKIAATQADSLAKIKSAKDSTAAGAPSDTLANAGKQNVQAGQVRQKSAGIPVAASAPQNAKQAQPQAQRKQTPVPGKEQQKGTAAKQPLKQAPVPPDKTSNPSKQHKAQKPQINEAQAGKQTDAANKDTKNKNPQPVQPPLNSKSANNNLKTLDTKSTQKTKPDSTKRVDKKINKQGETKPGPNGGF